MRKAIIPILTAIMLNLLTAQVVINEIHYNPSSTQGSDNDYEFMELYNPGATDIDMSGYSFTQGVTHVFADGTTLAAGAYLLLCRNAEFYGSFVNDGTNGQAVVDAVTWTSGSLGNSGEDIVIIDAATGAIVDSIDYEDNSDGWPSSADGGGPSLELIDPSSDNNLAENWQASWVSGGTPGAASSVELTPTVTTIYDIQSDTSWPSGASLWEGEYVETSGIVTAIDTIGTPSNFVIQDGSGGWRGIYCWWPAPEGVETGDNVTVRGWVTEYTAAYGDGNFSLTELTTGYVASVNSSGNSLPDAVTLSHGAAMNEAYEGVRVTIEGIVTMAVNEDSYGEWRISDAPGDTINVNDRFAITNPELGASLTVTGPLNQWSGSSNTTPSWRIEPATEADVVETCTGETFFFNGADSWGDGWNGGTYTLSSSDGTELYSGGLEGEGSSFTDEICVPSGTYTLVVGGGTYDSEISWSITDEAGNTIAAGAAGEFSLNLSTDPNAVFGCTDANAINYDGSATVDNGSCYYTGDACDYPLSASAGTNSVNGFQEQWFSYTSSIDGYVIISTLEMTDQDTWMAVLGSCETDDYGEFTNIYGISDDVVETEVFQSEVVVQVVAGTELLILFTPYYTSADFNFSITEEPLDETPVDLEAVAYNGQVWLSWAPIPSLRSNSRMSNGITDRYNPLAKRKALGLNEHTSYAKRKKADIRPENLNATRNTRECANPDTETEITFVCDGGSYASEVSWEILDESGTLVVAASGNTAAVGCLIDGEYTANGYDSYGDGWNGNVLTGTDASGSVVFSLTFTTGSSATTTFTIDGSAVYGCTDATALNYDATATDDDGSCYFTGDSCSIPIAAAAGTYAATTGFTYYSFTASEDGYLTVTSSDDDASGAPDYYYFDAWPNCEAFETSEYYAFDYYGSLETFVSAGTVIFRTYDYWAGTYDLPTSFTVSFTPAVYGCMDPQAENYNPDADTDDGSCTYSECTTNALVFNMYDSFSDGWNGATYTITNSDGISSAEGELIDGAEESDNICLDDGTYTLLVGGGSYDSEISWDLYTVTGGYVSGGLAGEFTFSVPLDINYHVYRDGQEIAIVTESAYVDGAVEVETEYCYTVSQEDELGSESSQSEAACTMVEDVQLCSPQDLSATPTGESGSVYLEWNVPETRAITSLINPAISEREPISDAQLPENAERPEPLTRECYNNGGGWSYAWPDGDTLSTIYYFPGGIYDLESVSFYDYTDNWVGDVSDNIEAGIRISFVDGDGNDLPGGVIVHENQTSIFSDGTFGHIDFDMSLEMSDYGSLIKVSIFPTTDVLGDGSVMAPVLLSDDGYEPSGWSGFETADGFVLGDYDYDLELCISQTQEATCGNFEEYYIYEGSDLIESSTVTSFFISGLTDNIEACFTVTAGYEQGESSASNEACAIPFVESTCENATDAVLGTNENLTGQDQYYSYTATQNGYLQVSSLGQTDGDTYLAILGSCEFNDYDGYTDIIAENDDSGDTPQSYLEIEVIAGETYIIAWISYYDPGSFSWTLDEEAYPTYPNLSAVGGIEKVILNWDPVLGTYGRFQSQRTVETTRSGRQIVKRPIKTSYNPFKYPLGLRPKGANNQNILSRNTRTCDNGETQYTADCSGGSWGSEISWYIIDESGANPDTLYAGGAPETNDICLFDGTYSLHAYDSWGDGWNGNVFSISDVDGNYFLSYTLDDGDFGIAEFSVGGTAPVFGCTDSDALNFNPDANTDDGTCYYAGEICESPNSGVFGINEYIGNDQWYGIDLPSTPGMLTISVPDTIYEFIRLVGQCSQDEYFIYTDQITTGYTSISMMFGFGTQADAGGNSEDYLGTTVHLEISGWYWTGGPYDFEISWIEIVEGCTDPQANNFNPDAQFDDGSCFYDGCDGNTLTMLMYDSFGDGWNGNSYTITDLEGVLQMEGTLDDGSDGAQSFCLDDGSYNIVVDGGSFQSEITWQIVLTESYSTIIAEGTAPWDGGFDIYAPAPNTYTITRDGTEIASGVTALSYNDLDVALETEYCYTVTEVNGDGISSDSSPEACASPLAPIAVPAPENLSGYANGYSVTLDWDDPEPYTSETINMLTSGNLDRQGGDTWEDATVIESIPYTVTGSTSDYSDDYDENCPDDPNSQESDAPDVVYVLSPENDIVVDVDLCGSTYDTKVYIYENEIGNLASTATGSACDDDFYGSAGCFGSEENSGGVSWVSKINDAILIGGNTYYVVVDGWSGSDFGDYTLTIAEPDPLVGYAILRDGELVGQSDGRHNTSWSTMQYNSGTVDYTYEVKAQYELIDVPELVQSDASNSIALSVEFSDGPHQLSASNEANHVNLEWREPMAVDNIEARYDSGIEWSCYVFYQPWNAGDGTAHGTRFSVEGEYTIKAVATKIWDGWPGDGEHTPVRLMIFDNDEQSEQGVALGGVPGNIIATDLATRSDDDGYAYLYFDEPLSMSGDFYVMLTHDEQYSSEYGECWSIDENTDYPSHQYITNGGVWSRGQVVDGDLLTMAMLDLSSSTRGASTSRYYGYFDPVEIGIPDVDYKRLDPKIDLSYHTVGFPTAVHSPRFPELNLNTRDLTGYNIVRNGEQINSVSETFYQDHNLSWGSYDYFVTANYTDHISPPSNMVTVDHYNDPPYSFNLGGPEQEFLVITPENIEESLQMWWDWSGDPDGDLVNYYVEIWNDEVSMVFPRNHQENSGFEDEADNWLVWPEDRTNWTIETNGNPIYGSDNTFTAFDGERGLKVWGQYDGTYPNNTPIYQGYTLLDHGLESGTMVSVEGMMMSHEDDWIGQGDNVAYLFISFFDESWNMIHSDFSNYIDKDQPASTWQFYRAISEVPDGATYMNAGVEFWQESDQDHGSVYFDNIRMSLPILDTYHDIPLNEIAEAMVREGVGAANFDWTVYAFDGFEGTEANNVWPIDIDATEILNTTANITFIADVSDIFGWDPDEHSMDVAGDFNGWSGNGGMDYDGQYYMITTEIYAEIGSQIEWKFKASPDELFENNGWEFGDNRTFEFTGEDLTIGPANPDIDIFGSNVMIGITSSGGLPGDTVSVSVWADLLGDFDMHSFLISVTGFGGDLMTFLSADTVGSMLPEDWLFTYNLDESGNVVITAGAGAESINGGGSLFNLHFVLSNEIEQGDFVDLFLINTLLNEDDGVTFFSESGGVIVLSYGDVSMNGTVTAFDGSLILQHLVGTADLEDGQADAGDVTQDASLSAMDAAVILDYVVGNVESLPIDQTMVMIAEGSVDIPGASVTPGDLITMPIQLEAGNNVRSFELELSYDPDVLLFNSISWDENIGGMSIVDYQEDGLIKATAAGLESITTGNITLGYIEFQMIDSFDDYQTTVTMNRSRLNESEAQIEQATAVFTNALLVVDEWGHGGVPEEFAIKQNFPNPFNPTTRIRYQLPEQSNVTIQIYDIMGRIVKTLVPNQKELAGFHQLTWDATNNNGDPVSAGMYLYVIQAGSFRDAKKMVLLK